MIKLALSIITDTTEVKQKDHLLKNKIPHPLFIFFVIFFIALGGFFLSSPPPVSAQVAIAVNPSSAPPDDSQTSVHFVISNLLTTQNYYLDYDDNKVQSTSGGIEMQSSSAGTIDIEICENGEVWHLNAGKFSSGGARGDGNPCEAPWEQGKYTFKVRTDDEGPVVGQKDFNVCVWYPTVTILTPNPTDTDKIQIKIEGLRGFPGHEQAIDNDYELNVGGKRVDNVYNVTKNETMDKLNLDLTQGYAIGEIGPFPGQHPLQVREDGGDHFQYFQWQFEQKAGGGSFSTVTTDPEGKDPCGSGGGGSGGPGAGSVPNKCGPNNEGYETALGCIPATVQGFVNTFLQIAIGIAGGIAFLMMVFGAIRILTSTGDPQALNAGRELIISAVSGLLFIALAIFLLRVIGFDILKLPIPK